MYVVCRISPKLIRRLVRVKEKNKWRLVSNVSRDLAAGAPFFLRPAHAKCIRRAIRRRA